MNVNECFKTPPAKIVWCLLRGLETCYKDLMSHNILLLIPFGIHIYGGTYEIVLKSD